jgi:hypothetical protein
MTNFRYPTLRSILLAATILSSPLIAFAPTSAMAEVSLGISVQLAPPMLPIYDQPPMPDVGYIWTPGYWAWADPAGYYWVPGTWVQPPTVGYLWTPPYWGWVDGAYLFNDGYWGAHVGFYGGVNYGFGYGGRGYDGGRWDHDQFVYNRAANNFGGVHVTNVYNQNVTVINRTQVSYVGGTGGTHARPTAAENAALHETHAPVTADQTRHVEAARSNPDFAASHNNGHPAVAATSRPGQFDGPAVTHARAGAPGPAIQPRPTNAAAAAGPAIKPRPTNAAAAPGPAIKPHPTDAAAAAPGPAVKPHPTNAAAAPGPAIKPHPTNAAAAPGPAIKPHPTNAAAAPGPAVKPHPTNAAAAAPPKPTHAAAAAPPKPTHAAAAAPPKPTHPAARAAAPRPQQPAAARTAEPRQAQPAAESDKEKKPD